MLTFRRLLPLLLVAIPILVVAIVFVWRMSAAAPSWYHPPNVNDPAVIGLAEDVEYRLVEEAHRIRESNESWTLRLREHQVNAWLAARLPKWIAHEKGWDWPSPFGIAQVHFTKHEIELAGHVATAAGPRFVVVRLTPRIDEDRLALAITGLSLGRVSLGSASVDRLLDAFAPEHRAELLESDFGSMVLDALAGGAVVEPTMRLADRRRIVLQAIVMHDGAVDVTLLTRDE